MTDLWPEDIRVVKEKAPVTILREQASLLGAKTKNIVTAEVKRVTVLKRPDFCFDFYIVGPALGNYRYKLFEIRHGIDLYPVTIELGDPEWAREVARHFEAWVKELSPGTSVQVRTEEEFVEYLRRIFESQKTRQVIRAILAQSGVEPDETP